MSDAQKDAEIERLKAERDELALLVRTTLLFWPKDINKWVGKLTLPRFWAVELRKGVE